MRENNIQTEVNCLPVSIYVSVCVCFRLAKDMGNQIGYMYICKLLFCEYEKEVPGFSLGVLGNLIINIFLISRYEVNDNQK